MKVKYALIIVSWTILIVLISVNAMILKGNPIYYPHLYHWYKFSDIDHLIFWLISLMCGGMMSDMRRVFLYFFVTASLSIIILLLIIAFLYYGHAPYLINYPDILFYVSFHYVFRNIFPTPLLIWFSASIVGQVISEYFRINILPLLRALFSRSRGAKNSPSSN